MPRAQSAFAARAAVAALFLAVSACNQSSPNGAAGTNNTAGAASSTHVALSAASYSVDEAAGSLRVTVNRAGSAADASSVSYATNDGTAVAGTDYTASSGTLQWAAGDSSPKTISIPISGSKPFSGSRIFSVKLTGPSSGTAVSGSGSANITIYGLGTAQFTASNYTIGQAAGSISITVTRAGSASGYIGVDYATQNGTAVAGSDYTATSGTLHWAENDWTSRTISIPISNATPFSGSKAFTIILANPGARAEVGSPSSATVTIAGDSAGAPGNLQLADANYTVAQNAGALTVSVSRDGGSSGAASVHYATSDGTAVAGSDYSATSGTLQWADGDASTKTFSVPISNATPFSGSKTFSIALSNAGGGAGLGSPASATASITGDTAAAVGTVQLSAATYAVDQNAGTLVVNAERLGGSHGAISVAYSTQNGTATAGSDYSSTTGTLQWADGDTTEKSISIPISSATPFSGSRSFTVTLFAPTGGTAIVYPGIATVTIAGQAPTGGLALSAAGYSVAQSAGSVTVTVERTGGSNGATSVAYATANGTAVAGTDYTATSGTLDWADGDASPKTFEVSVSDATPFQGQRSFGVALSNVTGGLTLATPHTATVTIDGNAPTAVGSLQLSQASYSVLQSAGSLSITVNRTGGSSGAVAVSYATANGTATAGTDYSATTGTLQWADGDATSKSFSIPLGSTAFSGSRQFSVTLSQPAGGATLSTPDTAAVTINGTGASTGGPSPPSALLLTSQSSAGATSLSWTAATPGGSPIAYYKIYRNGAAYATATGTSYTDGNAPNANSPSFTAPATIYSYAVSAVDANGNESTQALPKVYFYQGGVANQGAVDYSYGITENWQDTSGAPVSGSHDISLTYPASGGGFQPFSNVPLSPTYDLELGAFKYLTLDVKVTDTSHQIFISHISRLPPGDVYPREWVQLFSYCTPVVGQWVTCKIPLSALSIGFTNFTASLSGNQLNVTSMQSGVGVDAGGFVTGPGIPAGTYIVGTPGGITYNNGQPPGNGLGTYTVAGPGISSSTNVPSESMVEQRTALYKVDIGHYAEASGTTIYLNNIGWTTN